MARLACLAICFGGSVTNSLVELAFTTFQNIKKQNFGYKLNISVIKKNFCSTYNRKNHMCKGIM